MRSGFLSSSRFGTFFEDKKQPICKVVQLEKVQQLTQCKISLKSQRVFLLDRAGKLTSLNLKDKSISTLSSQKFQYFHPDSHSSLSLTAISPSSEILHVHFENKQVCRLLNPCLNALVSFQKNYLTDTILLAEPKTLVLVDCNRKIKSSKATDDLIVNACLLGINRFVCVLLRSGLVEIRQTSTLNVHSSFKLPFAVENMKIAASNCGKTIAVFGKSKWLFVLSLNAQQQIVCRLAELPFQSVLHLQFSYSEQMVLLGSDRILYGVYYEGETGSLRPIFNPNQMYIPVGFDISMDEKLIALIGGKIVYLLPLQKGLAKTIGRAEGTAIDFSVQTQSKHVLQVARQIQYEDQQLNDYSTGPKERQLRDNFISKEPPQGDCEEEEEEEREENHQNLEHLLQRQEMIKQALRNIRQGFD